MLQLILHLTGDYVLQNDWMAINKNKYTVKGWLACLVHCFIYSGLWLVFMFPYGVCAIVFVTHFVIDKFSLGRKFCEVTKGEEPDRWLVIVVDNTFHLICNFIAVRYFW